jgi:FkbM family methyltransferase
MAAPPYNCEVHSFDPSPTGKKTMERVRSAGKLSENWHYHDYGVWHYDGEHTVYAPLAWGGDQFTAECTTLRNGPNCTAAAVRFPVKTISTIMTELGHSHLSLLKIDTEGGEFEDLMRLHSDGTLDSIDAFCAGVDNTALLRHLHIKTIILPRQARVNIKER